MKKKTLQPIDGNKRRLPLIPRSQSNCNQKHSKQKREHTEYGGYGYISLALSRRSQTESIYWPAEVGMGTAGVVELELLFVPKFDPIVIDSSYWGGGTSSSATWVLKYDIGWRRSSRKKALWNCLFARIGVRYFKIYSGFQSNLPSPELKLPAPPHTWEADHQEGNEQWPDEGNPGRPTPRRRRPARGGGRPSPGTACGCAASRRTGSRWPGRGTGAPT